MRGVVSFQICYFWRIYTFKDILNNDIPSITPSSQTRLICLFKPLTSQINHDRQTINITLALINRQKIVYLAACIIWLLREWEQYTCPMDINHRQTNIKSKKYKINTYSGSHTFGTFSIFLCQYLCTFTQVKVWNKSLATETFYMVLLLT